MNTKSITLYYDDYEEIIEVPSEYVVCPTCRGSGSTVFGWGKRDAAVFTYEDFEQDPDLKDDLLNGIYNKSCPECNGLRVISVIIEERFKQQNPEKYELWLNQEKEMIELRQLEEMERRYGA